MDAGHWQLRQRMGTRWDERNVHAQCRQCNRREGGQREAHRMYIENKYGLQVRILIELKAKTPCQFRDNELLEMIEHYKSLTKQRNK
jgi:hypothetical protein